MVPLNEVPKHIDGITIALYLGGRYTFRKEYVEWIKSHLHTCDQCAERLQQQLAKIGSLQQQDLNVIVEHEVALDERAQEDDEHDHDHEEPFALVTGGYRYPPFEQKPESTDKGRPRTVLHKLVGFFEALQGLPQKMLQIIKQMIHRDQD